MKIGGGGHANSHSFSGNHEKGGQSHIPHSKNVRIMLVGNNGTKGGGHSFKANIVDQNAMSYVSGGSLPKTTKNNLSKFYTHGTGHSSGGHDIQNGFLNALSTP